MGKCDQIIDMKKVWLQTEDEAVIIGAPINIDYADDTGAKEDAICIETDTGKIISIAESIIKAFREE